MSCASFHNDIEDGATSAEDVTRNRKAQTMGEVILLKQRASSQDLSASPIRLLLPHQVKIINSEKLERDTEARATEVRRRIMRYGKLLRLLGGETNTAEFLRRAAYTLEND